MVYQSVSENAQFTGLVDHDGKRIYKEPNGLGFGAKLQETYSKSYFDEEGN